MTDTSFQTSDLKLQVPGALKLQVPGAFSFHPPCNPGDGFTNTALPRCLDYRCATEFLLMRFKLGFFGTSYDRSKDNHIRSYFSLSHNLPFFIALLMLFLILLTCF